MEHQDMEESLLNDPGSSPEEFEGKIRGLSLLQLKSLLRTVLRRDDVPSFVSDVLVDGMEARALEAAESVTLRALQANLPFCNDHTDSDAHINPKHDPRSRSETSLDFRAVQNIPENVWDDGVVNIGSDPNRISVHSENSVVFYLNNLYRGIIKALGLDKKLQVIFTRTVAGNECDIVLVAKETFQPLSVTEVKKPHSPDNDKQIFLVSDKVKLRRSLRNPGKPKSATIGQHFDQLHNVRWMNGLNRVYGMISTGNSFMLTCTEPFHSVELAIKEEIFITDQDNGNGEYRVSPNKPNIFADDEEEVTDYFQPPDENAELYTSQVIGIEDKDRAASGQILNMLILQVAKAAESLGKLPTTPTKLPTQGTVYSRQIDLEKDDTRTGHKQCFANVKLMSGWQQCRWHYIDESVKVVSLVRSVGSGVAGDCCLGVSENQDMSCVVKFFQASRDTTTLAQAKLEKDNWDLAYGTDDFETRVVILGDKRGCLVMPYVDIAEVNRDECLQNEAKKVKECLQRFSCKDGSDSFLLHRDVKWRHLGYFQGKLTLVDLGNVAKTQDKKQWEGWMKSCVNELTQTKSSGRRKRQKLDSSR